MGVCGQTECVSAGQVHTGDIMDFCTDLQRRKWRVSTIPSTTTSLFGSLVASVAIELLDQSVAMEGVTGVETGVGCHFWRFRGMGMVNPVRKSARRDLSIGVLVVGVRGRKGSCALR